jgi:hypothetical protein
MCAGFLLNAGNAHTTGVDVTAPAMIRWAAAAILCRPERAKPVDGHSGHSDRHASTQRDLSGNIWLHPLVSAHYDRRRPRLARSGAGHSVLNGVPAERGNVRHVERALAFGQGAGCGNNKLKS